MCYIVFCRALPVYHEAGLFGCALGAGDRKACLTNVGQVDDAISKRQVVKHVVMMVARCPRCHTKRAGKSGQSRTEKV